MSDNLFMGVFPGGISYADRSREEHGDYMSIAFLDFATLTLTWRNNCPPEMRERIETDAAEIQAREGELYQVSTVGQTVRLGSGLKGVSNA